jgi:hypothetical protein
MNPPQLAADYCARVLDPALHIIRARLLQHRPLNVVDYISQYHSQIKSDIEAAASASPAPAPHYSCVQMSQTAFPISESIIAVLQSASVPPPLPTDSFGPNVIAALSCVQQQYSLEHSFMMQSVVSLRNAWLAIGGAMNSD